LLPLEELILYPLEELLEDTPRVELSLETLVVLLKYTCVDSEELSELEEYPLEELELEDTDVSDSELELDAVLLLEDEVTPSELDEDVSPMDVLEELFELSLEELFVLWLEELLDSLSELLELDNARLEELEYARELDELVTPSEDVDCAAVDALELDELRPRLDELELDESARLDVDLPILELELVRPRLELDELEDNPRLEELELELSPRLDEELEEPPRLEELELEDNPRELEELDVEWSNWLEELALWSASSTR